MELAPRDIVSRAMMTEINEGRGFDNETGIKCMKLDLRHLGDSLIKEKLGAIREISIKFSGIDPAQEPLDVRPVAHYMMGGIHTNIDGATELEGVWASGEAACNSVHGANRLGANSTSECIVWGRITGELAVDYILNKQHMTPFPYYLVEAEEKRIYDGIFRGNGDVNPYEVRQELTDTLNDKAYVYRNESDMVAGLRNDRKSKGKSPGFAARRDRENRHADGNVMELDSM